MEATTLKPAIPAKRLSYYIELTKPRILIMILLTVVIAMVAVGSSVGLVTVLHACIGTALVAASASVLNQWLERDRDAVMVRTSKRPLPSGRVASSQAAWMGWLMVVVGSVYLGMLVNLPTMWCGLATWFLYVWVYTPLKTVSWTNTLVGTIPGALPVWMGWTAADGSLWDPQAWVLLGILIAWQLPHFMAIAFMYAEQYELAGYKMITVTDKSGVGAGLHAILGSLALVVLAPLAVPASSVFGWCLMLLAVAVAVWQLQAAIQFVRRPERSTARRMLHVSLLHLPLTMLLILLSCWL
ncbi:MAG: heme o synthase [bacterium]|nr:heme o synthase [bacterium]